jgi:hypothetical protein
MKVQCSCGAKHEFDLTADMRTNPVRFVCPACGLDSSEFVDSLIRRELGQIVVPTGVPVPIRLTFEPPAVAPIATAPQPPRPPMAVRIHTPTAPSAEPEPEPHEQAPVCLKHPGQMATERCYVCSKPICPKCMELFGYVCSPLCKAKADSHGLAVPTYQQQRSVVDARRWRYVVWAGSTVGALAALCVGFWFWYAWFGCLPRSAFSVRFPELAFSGQSVICGEKKDQIVFLHGDTLARYEIPSKKEIWSLKLLDRKKFALLAEQEIKARQEANLRLRDQGVQDLPRIPDAEKLVSEMEKAAAAELNLYVRAHNVWVASPGRLVRYEWQSGKPAKEMEVPAGYGGILSRGDELMLVDTESGKPVITRVNLTSCESLAEELSGPELKLPPGAPTNVPPARTNRPTDLAGSSPGVGTAGLPVGTPGRDRGKPLDPGKVAEQAQHLSLPAKLALPALLANSLNQERALAALDENQPGTISVTGPSAPAYRCTLIPTRNGFIQFGVRLLESRVVQRSAMKLVAAKSALEGNVTAGNSVEASNELLNEMQRSRGGDVVTEDQSRYQVTLRRPGGDAAWTGEVTGPPRLFPLNSVNVLAASKLLLVFNKDNRLLWQSSLNYTIEGGVGALDQGSAFDGQGPCVERDGSLYVFDQGVLTAFDLAKGEARWRLPTVGVAGLFFDDHGMIYVNTTTASHDTIKYSRQIDVSQKVRSSVLKVDPANGRILWNVDPGGFVNYVAGNVILVVQSYQPPEPDEDAHTVETGLETPPYLRIRRINPKNGSEIWEYFQQRSPLDVGFDKDTIRLVFRKEVQVLKFLAL